MTGLTLAQRPGAEETRARILKAAQHVFATKGYTQAGVRDITASAGVNPSLVSRYFGSKEALFEEALKTALDLSVITTLTRESFGTALVKLFTTEQPGRVNPLSMMVLAAADDRARQIALALLRKKILGPLSKWIGGLDGDEKASQIMLLASGLFLYRNIFPLAPLQGSLTAPNRLWLENAFQSVVDS